MLITGVVLLRASCDTYMQQIAMSHETHTQPNIYHPLASLELCLGKSDENIQKRERILTGFIIILAKNLSFR